MPFTVDTDLTVSGKIHSDRGAVVESNLASPRRGEAVKIRIAVQDTGGTNQFNVMDATGNNSGTSTHFTGGFHTTAGVVTALEAATSAGDTDANRVFKDTDNNYIRLKRTSGGALNVGTVFDGTKYGGNVGLSSIDKINGFVITADANFTGSPSALQIALLNTSGAGIDPFSLVSPGENFEILIGGYLIL